jgi:hypothetical protein
MTAHTTGIFPESLKMRMRFVCHLFAYGDCLLHYGNKHGWNDLMQELAYSLLNWPNNLEQALK